MSEYIKHSGEFAFDETDLHQVEELERMVVQRLKLIEKGDVEPESQDPVETAFFKVLVPELTKESQMRSTLIEVFANRRRAEVFSPLGQKLRIIDFAVDRQMRSIFRDEPGLYPTYFSGPGLWNNREVFNKLDYFELYADMLQPLRSSIPLGYAMFKALSHSYRNRWTDNPVVVDTGASLGLGPIQWLTHTLHPFRPLKVVHPPQPGQPITPNLDRDFKAEETLNDLTAQEPIIDRIVGYDILPLIPAQPEATDMVFSHTFPMSESLRDPQGVTEFYSLAAQNAPDYLPILSNVNAADETSLAVLKDFLPDGKADIFICSAVLFEMSPESVAKTINNLREYCNPGALFFISDFARVNPGVPNNFDFIRKDWWHRPGSFATFVMDPFKPEQPPIETCRFLTRRCEAMWFTEEGRSLLLREKPI